MNIHYTNLEENENKLALIVSGDAPESEYATITVKGDRWDFYSKHYKIDNRTKYTDKEICAEVEKYINKHSVHLQRAYTLQISENNGFFILKSVIGEVYCHDKPNKILNISCSTIGIISNCEIICMVNTRVHIMKNCKVHHVINCTIDRVDDETTIVDVEDSEICGSMKL